MNPNRRIFLSVLFFAKPMRVASLEVEVLETFDLDGRSVAILAHHSDPKSREQFAPRSTEPERIEEIDRIVADVGVEIFFHDR